MEAKTLVDRKPRDAVVPQLFPEMHRQAASPLLGKSNFYQVRQFGTLAARVLLAGSSLPVMSNAYCSHPL